MESSNIKQALTEIKSILNTPLKMTSAHQSPLSNGEGDTISEGDLPGQLTKVLGKGASSLYIHGVLMFNFLID